MAAGKHDNLVVELVTLELLHHVPGKFRQEGQIVIRINDERLYGMARILSAVRHRADAAPQVTQAFEIDFCFQSLTDVARGLSVPDYVGEISRGVIECGDPD